MGVRDMDKTGKWLEGLAEREGFEPPLPARVNLISSQARSARLCHLSIIRSLTYSFLRVKRISLVTPR